LRYLGEVAPRDDSPLLPPELTFYRTLKAPVPVRSPATINPTRHSRASSPAQATGGRPITYTIQLAAFNTRAQADALRERLGVGAYVVETDRTSVARYRVRFGQFVARADAEAAAARLRAERALRAFVTSR
jgi:cell division septation protein DedD